MFIVLDKLVELDGKGEVDLRLFTSGHALSLEMSAKTFSIEVKDGKVENKLFRWLTAVEARRLAQAILDAVDLCEEQQATVVVTSQHEK